MKQINFGDLRRNFDLINRNNLLLFLLVGGKFPFTKHFLPAKSVNPKNQICVDLRPLISKHLLENTSTASSIRGINKSKELIDGMGYFAYISDTEGNLLGLWEDVKK